MFESLFCYLLVKGDASVGTEGGCNNFIGIGKGSSSGFNPVVYLEGGLHNFIGIEMSSPSIHHVHGGCHVPMGHWEQFHWNCTACGTGGLACDVPVEGEQKRIGCMSRSPNKLNYEYGNSTFHFLYVEVFKELLADFLEAFVCIGTVYFEVAPLFKRKPSAESLSERFVLCVVDFGSV